MRPYLFAILLMSFCGISKAQTISGPSDLDPFESGTFTNSDASTPTGFTYTWEYQGDVSNININANTLSLRWLSPGVYFVSLWKDYGSDNVEFVHRVNVKVGNPPSIEYVYDAAGNRTSRTIKYFSSNSLLKSVRSNTDIESETIEDAEIEIEEEFNGLKKFNIYPNPVQQMLFVSLTEEALSSNDSQIIIYNTSGKIVMQKPAVSEVESLNFSSLRPGIYILKLRYKGGSKDCKIVKID